MNINYFFLLLLLIQLCFTSATRSIINKCYYEGDYTVYCNPAKSMSNDAVDMMRYARVINGIQYKENYCSFTNLTCYKEQYLNECIDKQECFIKNSWFAIPECRGNSYYTQFEYDCQPSYYMCDKTTINNLFSGLVLSPAYPHSYKLSSSKPCYLTIHVPANHYIELTVDYFTLVKTHQCIGDYLNIQEYVDAKQQKDTVVGSNRKQWRQLSTWCGKKEAGYTLIAKSDTVSFTFRSFNMSNLHVNHDELKFKIFFQAIPANVKLAEDVNKKNENNLKPNAIQSTNKNELKEKTTTATTAAGYSASLWYFGAGVGVSLFILLVLAVIVIIILIRRNRLGNTIKKQSPPSSLHHQQSQNNSNNNNGKQLNNNFNNNDINPKLNNLAAAKQQLQLEVDDNDIYLNNSYNSQLSTTAKLNNNNLNTSQASKASKLTAAAAAAAAANTAEPRKMQAERSALLQDLSQSKLLTKYKLEFQSNAPVAHTTTATEVVKSENSSKVDEVVEAKTRSQNSSVKTSPTAKTFDYGGIYGAEVPADSGGVYGADPIPVVIEKKNLVCSSPMKTSTTKSNEESLVKTDVPTPVEEKTLTTTTTTTEVTNTTATTTSNEICSSTIRNDTDYSETARLLDDDNNQSLIANGNLVDDSNENSNLLEYNEENQGIVSGHLGSSKIDNDEMIDNNDDDDDDYVDNAATSASYYQSTSGLSTPRKTAFNPLHVILKDKNKYYTTEYI